MSIKNVKLIKGMTNKEVNTLLQGNKSKIKLIDDMYLGNKYGHNWECECGKIFKRRWNAIHQNNNIKCETCKGHRFICDTHPDISKTIICDEYTNDVNIEIVSTYSNRKFYMSCPKCGEISIEPKILYDVVRQGYSCHNCTNNISIGESMMSLMLKKINVSYTKEVIFKWSKNIETSNKKLNGNKRYDFYIEPLSMIIEIHGKQHYENSSFERTLKEERENDRIKRELALSNGIEHYITIDCRYSKLEWLKDNITNELSPYFNLDTIDFKELYLNSQKSSKIKTWELRNRGLSAKNISKELDLHISTIIRYLNDGDRLGKCNYDGKEECIHIGDNNYNSRKVICITTGEVFGTIQDASKKYKVLHQNIGACCRGLQKTCGEFEGERLKWMYYDEYESNYTNKK